MIKERGQISKIEGNGVWVKTIAQSTCNACQARHGCGQKLLNQIGVPTSSIWASLSAEDAQDLQEGEWVELGVEEGAVVLGSLLAYGLPVLLLVAGAALGQESAVQGLVGAAVGLAVGVMFSRFILRRYFGPRFFEPRVLARVTDEQAVTLTPS